MSGDTHYPGWCCRQVAAQLSQALFTMADLHAQVSDLREENRQLKIKIESINSRRLNEDVSLVTHAEDQVASNSFTPTSCNPKPFGGDSRGTISPHQQEAKLKNTEDLSQDPVPGLCSAGAPPIVSEAKPQKITFNLPLKQNSDTVNLELQTSGDHKCEKCESCFPNSDLLTIHQAVHIGRSFHVCKVCNAMFLLKADLSRHWATHPNMKQHICQLCGKAYTSKNNYKLHIKTHTGVGLFPCEVCGKAFHSENHLNVHRRIHTGERPFECQFCDKSFTQKSGLINHTRLHTGEKPFLCPSCPKAFTQKSNLNFHLSKHHPPTGEIPSL
ncbi:Zinc finger protein 566 [Frankliniella fusca]|uniref:Zinc finger protein 566 n=1 Tax=Frankliniella fusca TaxID=407009 RepID=A0AAE1HC03_9NEOP|nr:Zinc finger protein 566 [Frankliniella fusca]